MKKIIINKDNLSIDNSWLKFKKVRIIIEDNKGKIIISSEGGKPIFPGGKCKTNEDIENAILREVKEETGIELDEKLLKVLEIETYYKDFYDYRSNSNKPRYTDTIYFYVKTDKEIDYDKTNYTQGEIKENLKAFKLSKEELINYLNVDHSDKENGKFFDEENKIVLDEIILKNNH